MPISRPRFRTPTRSVLLVAAFLTLLAHTLTACVGPTGPSRRHLAAVESAEDALALPAPDRRRALEAARDELRAVLETSPGLSGAKLSLATVYARLDEPSLALGLAPPVDEQRPEERPGWSALETWALARANRWDELLAKTPGGELATLASRYRHFAVAESPCEPQATGASAPSAPTGPCCADPAASCRDCLAAIREAWCRRTPSEPIEGFLTSTGAAAPSPHLELARARLRAAIFAEAGRHEEARLALEAAREAAQAVGPAPAPGASQPSPPPLALQALELDRAILYAWAGELEESRAILTTMLANPPPEPLLSRVRGLMDALSPPTP